MEFFRRLLRLHQSRVLASLRPRVAGHGPYFVIRPGFSPTAMQPSTADELAHRLEQLDLLSEVQLSSAWSDLGGRNVSAADLGAALLRRELLTSYQLDRVMRGESTGFLYGRAKILYQVGAGSFSRVYRAIHADSGRILAVKVLRARHSSDADKRQAFQREAEIGRMLRHPNIVAIEDVGAEFNSSYITMEFVEGQTLRELVRVRGAIDLPRTLTLLFQMVEGLEYAHRLGVTHRDVKASNVLISFAGQAKLVDFGLAGGASSGRKSSRSSEQPRTIDYAALESAGRAKNDSVRSDIYFLGTLAYLALAGSPALRESRDRSVRSDPRRFAEVEPLGWKAPHVPRDVIDLVSRMMHLNPDERFQAATEVRRALEPLIARHTGAVEAPPKPAAKPAVRPAAAKGTLMLAEAASEEQGQLRAFFQDLGYRVLLTENLQRALLRCSETPRPADCLVIRAASFGPEAVDAFNALGGSEQLATIPALLLVDPSHRGIAVGVRTDARRKMIDMPLEKSAVAETLEEVVRR